MVDKKKELSYQISDRLSECKLSLFSEFESEKHMQMRYKSEQIIV